MKHEQMEWGKKLHRCCCHAPWSFRPQTLMWPLCFFPSTVFCAVLILLIWVGSRPHTAAAEKAQASPRGTLLSCSLGLCRTPWVLFSLSVSFVVPFDLCCAQLFRPLNMPLKPKKGGMDVRWNVLCGFRLFWFVSSMVRNEPNKSSKPSCV